jgi:hypothetical protein
MLVRDKHSLLFDPFVSYEKMKCCEYAPGDQHVMVIVAYEWAQ